jgi:hypothetical protein
MKAGSALLSPKVRVLKEDEENGIERHKILDRIHKITYFS